MSRRQSHTSIISCLLFTGFLLASIDLGQGIKCYICDSRQDRDCLNKAGELKECSKDLAMTPRPDSTTTTKPETLPTITSSDTSKPTESTATEPTSSPDTSKPTKSTATEPTSSPDTSKPTESTATEPTSSPDTSKPTESTATETTSSADTSKPTESTATETTSSADTSKSTESPTKSRDDTQPLNFMFYDSDDPFADLTNETYECFTLYATINNQTNLVEEKIRGCARNDTLNCNNFAKGIMDLRYCEYTSCDSDECNSSNMEKMGIISLVLPLITVLLRIR